MKYQIDFSNINKEELIEELNELNKAIETAFIGFYEYAIDYIRDFAYVPLFLIDALNTQGEAHPKLKPVQYETPKNEENEIPLLMSGYNLATFCEVLNSHVYRLTSLEKISLQYLKHITKAKADDYDNELYSIISDLEDAIEENRITRKEFETIENQYARQITSFIAK